MPQMTISITANLDDPADVALADSFIDAVRRATVRGAPVNISGELKAAEPEQTEPPKSARGRKPKEEPAEEPKAKEFVIFKADGERRAGYSISKDAADVLIFDAEKLDSSADLTAFGKHNIPTIARLDKADQERVQAAITLHVQNVKAAEAEAAKVVTAPPSSEDALAAAFGGTVETQPIERTMNKDDFIAAMIELAEQMGPTASRAWITSVGFATPVDVPEEQRNMVVAAGKAHVAKLKGE